MRRSALALSAGCLMILVTCLPVLAGGLPAFEYFTKVSCVPGSCQAKLNSNSYSCKITTPSGMSTECITISQNSCSVDISSSGYTLDARCACEATGGPSNPDFRDSEGRIICAGTNYTTRGYWGKIKSGGNKLQGQGVDENGNPFIYECLLDSCGM